MGKQPPSDPAVAELEAGLAALYKGRWAEAEKRFTAAIEQSDVREVTSRARQLLTVARSRAAERKAEPADPYLEAVFLKNRGDFAGALDRLSDGNHQDDRCLYLTAALYAALEKHGDAVRMLGKAIAANPANRVHAFHDPDFDELRRQPEHSSLFGLD